MFDVSLRGVSKDTTPQVRQATAALRDFNPANDGCGSTTEVIIAPA
jgi:hypothetical protein